MPGGVPPHPDDLSSLCQSAPLEVDRSSSQSALSERSGRWNGRVWWTCVLASDRGCTSGIMNKVTISTTHSGRGEVHDLVARACGSMPGRSVSLPSPVDPILLS